MRRFSCCILALFAFGPVARAAEIRAFEDATLRAVHFVDDNVGWAVGDDGVVWNTLDAGKHWDRQSTGVNASLRPVGQRGPQDAPRPTSRGGIKGCFPVVR